MGLNKYKVGDLITVVDERNNIGIREFYGINSKRLISGWISSTHHTLYNDC